MIQPGTQAPDFSLRDQDGSWVGLADFADRRLVICFYPVDFSPGCTNQLSVYQEVLDEIEARGASLVGVSVDSAFCHRAFRDQLNLRMPLLADFHPKGEMARAYGVYNEEYGTANRTLFLVGGDGVVSWSHAARAKEIPGANLIFDALGDA